MQYIARQPIFDAKLDLQAYELLFRDSEENRCQTNDLDFATKTTMDTAVLMGLDTLSHGHSMFLNCTHDLIVQGLPTLFPPELTVVEVLETVRPSPEVIAACKGLKKCGYRLALDDFVHQPGYEPLIDLADIIKVDFRASTLDVWRELAANYLAHDRHLLAEKVETEEEFRTATELGYSLFQGYFFSKPNVLSTSRVDGLDVNHFRIFRVLGNPQLNFVELEAVIKSDPALCYRLLRFMNSPAYYLQSEIRSILHALLLLGEAEIRKWLLLVCAVVATRGSKPHLLSATLVRARFAELLGPEVLLPSPALFILGLMSLMDAILNMPLNVIADQIAVSTEIRDALMGKPNRLRKCLDLILAYESADWTRCEELRRSLRISSEILSKSYVEAVRWAKRLSEGD